MSHAAHTYKLVVRSGLHDKHRVFVQLHDTHYSEPIQEWIYYPVSLDERSFNAYGLESGEPCEPRGNGRYRLPNHRSGNGDYLHVELVDRGATLPTHVAKANVEPPKVRRGIELRWLHGRWEKLLKSKGWVPA